MTGSNNNKTNTYVENLDGKIHHEPIHRDIISLLPSRRIDVRERILHWAEGSIPREPNLGKERRHGLVQDSQEIAARVFDSLGYFRVKFGDDETIGIVKGLANQVSVVER